MSRKAKTFEDKSNCWWNLDTKTWKFWSTGVVPNDTTIFYQTVTNIHACSTTDSIQVDVQLPVTASVSGDSVMCFGFYVDLQANGGLYYQWYLNEEGLFSTTSSSSLVSILNSSFKNSIKNSNPWRTNSRSTNRTTS